MVGRGQGGHAFLGECRAATGGRQQHGKSARPECTLLLSLGRSSQPSRARTQTDPRRGHKRGHKGHQRVQCKTSTVATLKIKPLAALGHRGCSPCPITAGKDYTDAHSRRGHVLATRHDPIISAADATSLSSQPCSRSPPSPSSMDASALRAEIKQWEHLFKEQNGRNATIQDIRDTPGMREYKQSVLSTIHLVGSLIPVYSRPQRKSTGSTRSLANKASLPSPTTPPHYLDRPICPPRLQSRGRVRRLRLVSYPNLNPVP